MSQSLTQAKGYVVDAFNLVGGAVFKPEQIGLGTYTFLPWVRSGLAASLVAPAGGAVRATVNISVQVQDINGGHETVSKTLTLRGPGDVIGVDSTQIVRRVPQPNTVNVEESFLAHVEFDRPELPWLFTPLTPTDPRWRPWLVLVVCDSAACTLESGPPGLPERIRTVLGELPPLQDAWAFAHAQIVGPAKGAQASVADRLSDAFAATNLSRLLCPRKLDPNRSYIAALVPSFDCGVRAGLGLGGGTLDFAWPAIGGSNNEKTEVVLPIYDSWRFSTASAGDFESLAKRLQGTPAPWNVGRRLIDASDPHGHLPALAAQDPGRIQVLRCAVVSNAQPPAGMPQESSNWNSAMRSRLRDEVDRAGAAPDAVALPRVGPRLYARFQRGQSTTGAVFDNPNRNPDQDWFTQLNTSPMHRVVGGLGTRVVQRDCEQLMQAAWQQVGAIRAANQSLLAMQFGRYIGEALHRLHLSKLPLGDLTQVMRPVQAKVRLGSDALTVYGVVGRSATPPAALGAAFRRATSLRGPVARAAGANAAAALSQMVASQAGFKDLRRSYTEPDGIKTVPAPLAAALPAALVAQALGVTEAKAKETLTSRFAGAPASQTAADRLEAPLSAWTISAGTTALGQIGAAKLAQRVGAALPDRLTADPARVSALAPLLVGVANTGLPQVSQAAADRVKLLDGKVPFDAASPAGGAISVTGLPSSVGTRVAVPGGMIAGPATVHPAAPGLMAAPLQPRTATVTTPTRAAGAVTATPVLTSPVLTPPVTTRPVLTTPVFTGPVSVPAPPTTSRPAPLQRFETSSSRAVTLLVTSAPQQTNQSIAQALSQVGLETAVSTLPKTPDRPVLSLSRDSLLTAVAPALTVTAYAKSRLARMPSWLAPDWFDDLRINPIMAAPRFDRPMYEALDAYDRNWLIPGLATIADPQTNRPLTDFVTVLFTNPAFTEAFLTGLSDEMGRQLLWRGYPTDQRGTYFWRFWHPEADELLTAIHTFSRAPLGTHLSGGGGDLGNAVLVVRGELVRRYPDLIGLALRAGRVDHGKPVFIDPDSNPSAMAQVLFHDHLDPDILLIGFQLTAAQLLDPNENWWFVLAEHPTAPRFGLDLPTSPQSNLPIPAPPDQPTATPPSRNDLDWNDLGDLKQGRFLSPRSRSLTTNDPDSDPPKVTWPGGSSAVVARTLLQNPIRAAFNAHKLLSPAVGK